MSASTNLFLSDPHVVADISEDGRLDEVTSRAGSIPPAHQLRSLLFAAFNQSLDLVELLLVDLSEETWLGR